MGGATRTSSLYFTKMMTNDRDDEIRALTKLITKPRGMVLLYDWFVASVERRNRTPSRYRTREKKK